MRDLHFSGDDLCILAGPTMVLNGDIRVLKWPGARPTLAANREPGRFESALTESVPLPHGGGSKRAKAICDLPPTLSDGKVVQPGTAVSAGHGAAPSLDCPRRTEGGVRGPPVTSYFPKSVSY